MSARPTAKAPTRPWAPTPGPLDRVSFFSEQERHRRATWLLTGLCAVAVTAMGLVVSLILTPLLMAQIGIVLAVLGIVLPIPDFLTAIPQGYADLLHPLMHQDQRPATANQVATGWALLLVPGVALLFSVWWWLRALLRREGVGGTLLELDARAPRPGDLEEQQLVNVVAEMALAAGLPAPRVLLLESDLPNVATVGTSADDATVVVSRGLLDGLDRDQTQAALGHAIGAIGNGDLRIAFAIVSVYQTFGLVMTLLDLPFSKTARATLGRALRLALSRAATAGEADKLSGLLSETFQSRRLDEIGQFIEPPADSALGRLDQRSVVFRGIRCAALMPLLFANLFGKIALLLLLPLLLGPLMAWLWRTRRYLADATAVQLTRNPDAMASALAALGATGGLPAGSRWSAHLFMVGTEVAAERARQNLTAQLGRLGAALKARPLQQRLSAGADLAAEAMRQAHAADAPADAGTFAEANAILVNFHPPVRKRLERLQAQGGRVASGVAH